MPCFSTPVGYFFNYELLKTKETRIINRNDRQLSPKTYSIICFLTQAHMYKLMQAATEFPLRSRGQWWQPTSGPRDPSNRECNQTILMVQKIPKTLSHTAIWSQICPFACLTNREKARADRGGMARRETNATSMPWLAPWFQIIAFTISTINTNYTFEQSHAFSLSMRRFQFHTEMPLLKTGNQGDWKLP